MIWVMELGLTIRAGSPPRYTPPRRITLKRCRSSCWSITKRAFLSEKDIFPMAVPNTFSTIVELLGGAAEFPLPAGPRGRALLKFLILGTMVSLVGYSVTFPGGWILI